MDEKKGPNYSAPALYFPDGNDTRQMEITSLNIEGEFYIAQAFMTYTFTYKNPIKKNVSGLFTFPTEGTVTHFEAVFPDGRMIDTAVIAREDLEQMEKQKPKGKKGSDQLNELAKGVPDLFRIPVQGIKKNEEFTVTVQVLETLEFRPDQRYHLDLKTTFEKGIQDGAISIQFQIHTGYPRELFYFSETHNITKREGTGGASHYLSLLPKSPDPTDVRFSYYMPSTEIMGALLQQDGNPTAYDPRGSFMMFLTPPSHTMPPYPRDIIFLVDRSGSMTGTPFQQATQALGSAFGTLNPQCDMFSLVMYDHEFKNSMASNGMLQPATPQNVQHAINYMNTHGPNGATDIASPLMWALNTLKRASVEAPQRISVKSIVLITDGCVEGERKLARQVEEFMKDPASRYIRIHTIGLGQYCNHQFLRMLSLVGRGFNENVIDMRQEGLVQKRTLRLMHSMSNPVLSYISLAMQAEGVELYPFPIPDLFKGAPLLVAGKHAGQFPQQIGVQGFLPDGKQWNKSIMTVKSNSIPVDRVFAKARIDDLTAKYWLTEDEKIKDQIIQLSVETSMPSAYTTVVAYETTTKKKEKEEKEQKDKKSKKKPSAGKAAMIGALAVGGVLAIGAGVYLLGGAGAINATAQGLSSVGGAAVSGIGNLIGSAGDCCGGCCNGLFASFDPLCGSMEPVCGSCGEVCGCIADTPFGSCGDICGNACDSICGPIGDCCGPIIGGVCGPCCEVIGEGTASCGDIISACNPGSIGELLGSCGSVTSVGDLCGAIDFGSIGDLCGSVGSVGDVFGSIGDICQNVDLASCGDICNAICDIIGNIK